MSAATQPGQVDADLVSLISRGADALTLRLDQAQIARLVAYVRLIERWNATYNLTAVRDPRDMVTQHVMDCLTATAALSRRRGETAPERVLDVGSGAGLPGIVVAIATPARNVVCIDSVGKKAAFITQVAGVLGLENVSALHSRVEMLTCERFDVIASRAFATLNDFVGASRHLLKARGTWMAMKGKVPSAELLELRSTFHVEPLSVPGLAAQRCIVWIDAPEMKEASARS